MKSRDQNRAVNDAFEQLLGPDATVIGSTKDEIKTAGLQERWAYIIGGASLLIGLLLAWLFDSVAGISIAVVGVLVGLFLRLDAAFVRITLNQCAIIELQKETIRELRRSRGN